MTPVFQTALIQLADDFALFEATAGARKFRVVLRGNSIDVREIDNTGTPWNVSSSTRAALVQHLKSTGKICPYTEYKVVTDRRKVA